MKVRKELWLVLLIFLIGFLVRIFSVIPANTIIGFDQARDLWEATKIIRDHHLAIIGPTAGNNPNLHHGVMFWYYMIIPLFLARGNPMGVVIWNSFFNALTIIVLYFFANSLFKSKKVGLIAATIVATSYYYVQFSGWISNPTVCLFTVPVFFFGLWEYYKGKKWGLPLSVLFLGLSIQFELFFIYLIPTFIIAWIFLSPKLPSLKLAGLSIFLFILSTLTMILTEFKNHFGGIRGIFGAGNYVGGNTHSDFFGLLINFLETKWDAFYLNFWPQNKAFGVVFGVVVVGLIIYETLKDRKTRKRNLYLLLIFFSPAVMLILGTHNAPWFLIGRPMSIILMSAYIISKLKYKFLIAFVLIFIIFANLSAVRNSKGHGQRLLEPDNSAIMSDQLNAIDYTYQSSNGQQFEINTLTNPLYVNALWSYHYFWYGQNKYRHLPSFIGGDQLYPYNVLAKSNGKEKYLYLIMDTSERIPPQYREEIIKSADKIGKLLEEKYFGGINVQKRTVEFDKRGD